MILKKTFLLYSRKMKQVVLGWILLNPFCLRQARIRSYIYDSGCILSDWNRQRGRYTAIQHVTLLHFVRFYHFYQQGCNKGLICYTRCPDVPSNPRNPNLRSASKYQARAVLIGVWKSIWLNLALHIETNWFYCNWWLKFTSLTWGRLIIFQFTVVKQPSRPGLCNKTTNFIS